MQQQQQQKASGDGNGMPALPVQAKQAQAQAAAPPTHHRKGSSSDVWRCVPHAAAEAACSVMRARSWVPALIRGNAER